MGVISPGVKKIIEANAASLATVNKAGVPHAIAVACIKVIEDNIIITNTHISETLKNLELNDYVALAVWNREWEKSCVGFEVKGRAKYHKSGQWLDYVKKLPDNEGCDVKGAIVIKAAKIKMLKS
jgi:predicted pyridoxine 5'-phosphate oxidase superfamily flavin-nucleotide-binding protein